jgi:hypothetical protein
MSVTTGNNFNEFWDFYNGMSVPAGSPKATQDAKYPPLSRAVSGLDSAAGVRTLWFYAEPCTESNVQEDKQKQAPNRTELNGWGCR